LKLMENIMQHMKGDVDGFIDVYLRLVMLRWEKAERSDTKVLLANMIANSLWYNPVLTIYHLKQQGAYEIAFSKWFEMIDTNREDGKMKYFLKQSDKKICVLGLGSLLALPDDQFPPENRPSQILGAIMKILFNVQRQQDEAQDSSEDEDYDPDDESGDEEIEEDQDDESAVESNASSAYKKLLESETRKLLMGYQGSDSDDYCESDMSSDDDEAPIYVMDPFVAFCEMLEYLESTNSARLQSMLAEIDDQGRNTLHQMMEMGRQKKAEALKNAAQLNGNQ